ncbi:hypothetical protein HMPREF0156_00650 [Bacteroidetes oral taxon 274 str. F0058]|nr:hypothetical protein HMPREF0156_00650 [Bacteroidetes oral taxon 274 str. F0058]
MRVAVCRFRYNKHIILHRPMADNNTNLIGEVKDYLRTEIDILKLNLLEKTARILTIVMGVIIAAVLSIIAIAYFSFMLFDMFKGITGSVFWATVITILLFIALSVAVFMLSEKLFLNFFVRKIYNIFFDGENKNDTADDRQENTPTIKDDETSY